MSATEQAPTRRGPKPSQGTLRARADVQAIVAARRSGESCASIAERYGCSRDVIAALSVGHAPSSRVIADADRIKLRFARGESVGQIAKDYGVSWHTVSKAVKGTARELPKTPIGKIRLIPTSVFAEAYERLGTYEAAAVEIGCTSAAVRRRLGLSKPYPKGRITLGQMAAMYEGGASVDEVARAAGLTRSTTNRRLRYAGVEIRCGRTSGRASSTAALRLFEHEVCLLYRAGASSPLIADVFETSEPAVTRLLDRNGLQIRGTRMDPSKRQAMRRLTVAVRRGELVAEAGRLVQRRVARDQGQATTSTAQEGTN